MTKSRKFERMDLLCSVRKWGEVSMLADKLKLTAKEILEKEFQSGIRGYKPEEVDRYLDLVIKDYETMHQFIDELQQENLRLKKQIEDQPRRQPVQQAAGTTNFDILKRLSNLEKHVFGSKLDEQTEEEEK